jgi:ApbE superfamily uncharacterized protein (UPF0280 family)
MWYAVTAKPVKLKSREKKKEFYRGEIEVIINAETREKLESKLKETLNRYPQETIKYLKAGIKFVEANNIIQAKRRSKEVDIYFDHTGQYKLL